MKFAIFLKSSLLFDSFYGIFLFVNKTLRLNNFKTRADMSVQISVFVICVEAIIYLLLYNLKTVPLVQFLTVLSPVLPILLHLLYYFKFMKIFTVSVVLCSLILFDFLLRNPRFTIESKMCFG